MYVCSLFTRAKTIIVGTFAVFVDYLPFFFEKTAGLSEEVVLTATSVAYVRSAFYIVCELIGRPLVVRMII